MANPETESAPITGLERAARLTDRDLGIGVGSANLIGDVRSLLDDLDPGVRAEVRASLETLQHNSTSKEDYAVLGVLKDYAVMVELANRLRPVESSRDEG